MQWILNFFAPGDQSLYIEVRHTHWNDMVLARRTCEIIDHCPNSSEFNSLLSQAIHKNELSFRSPNAYSFDRDLSGAWSWFLCSHRKIFISSRLWHEIILNTEECLRIRILIILLLSSGWRN